MVVRDGMVWRLSTTEPGNGYAANAYQVTYQQADLTTGQSSSPDLTSAANGDVIVCFAAGFASGASGGTPLNMTGLVSQFVTPGSGGYRWVYAGWRKITDKGTDPAASFNIPSLTAWGRVTWAIVRGAASSPTVAAQYVLREGGLADSGQPYIYCNDTSTASQAGACALMQVAAWDDANGFSADMRIGGDVARTLPDFGGIAPVSGGFLAACASGRVVGSISSASPARMGSFGPAFASLGGFDQAYGILVLVDGAAAATPYFDTAAWVRVDTSTPGIGDELDLGAVDPASSVITPRVGRRNFVALSEARHGSVSSLSLSTPAAPSSGRGWFDLGVRVTGRRRRVGMNLSTAPTGVLARTPLYEFGREPGSTSWVRFQWDALRSAWRTVEGWGDCSIRHYEMWTPSASATEAGLPVYFSPELVRNTARLTAVKAAVAAVPMSVRRLLGDRGVVVEGLDYAIQESTQHRTSSSTAVAEYTPGRVVCSSNEYESGSSLGQITLHEFGHAVDQLWYLTGSRTAGGSPLSGRVTASAAWIALHDAIAGDGDYPIVSPGLDNSQEFFAQLVMTQWQGTAAGSWTWADTEIDRLTTAAHPAVFGQMIDLLGEIGLPSLHSS